MVFQNTFFEHGQKTAIEHFLNYIAQTKKINYEVSKTCSCFKNNLQRGVKYFSEVKHHVRQEMLFC